MVADSNKRPDVIIHAVPACAPAPACAPVWTDIITVTPTSSTNCVEAALIPGAAATRGDALKGAGWNALAASQGATFFALSFESHGRLGEPAFALLSQQANASGPTVAEHSGWLQCKMQIMRWALTLLHVTNMRGVAAVICANRPIPAGPRLLCPVIDAAAPRPGRRSVALAHDRPPGPASPPWGLAATPPAEPADTPAAALAASVTPAHHTAPAPLLTTPGTAFPFSAVP